MCVRKYGAPYISAILFTKYFFISFFHTQVGELFPASLKCGEAIDLPGQ